MAVCVGMDMFMLDRDNVSRVYALIALEVPCIVSFWHVLQAIVPTT